MLKKLTNPNLSSVPIDGQIFNTFVTTQTSSRLMSSVNLNLFLDKPGADSGFLFRVGRKRLCARTHMTSTKHNMVHYTGWPRKNATTLIVNFKNIVDETELFFILFGRTFIFQQIDTMIINFG